MLRNDEMKQKNVLSCKLNWYVMEFIKMSYVMMYMRTHNIITVSFSFMSLWFCILWLANVVELSHYQKYLNWMTMLQHILDFVKYYVTENSSLASRTRQIWCLCKSVSLRCMHLWCSVMVYVAYCLLFTMWCLVDLLASFTGDSTTYDWSSWWLQLTTCLHFVSVYRICGILPPCHHGGGGVFVYWCTNSCTEQDS
jgi:hypothetical protein